ncbi:hypothetical protein [Pantoea sp.]|uniref:hypothetical protein n=1 Tax=Pantoea sp. TaxID=69393 RepID=UPI00289C19BD|nr:hypothetical protein [Pantoea sp.]
MRGEHKVDLVALQQRQKPIVKFIAVDIRQIAQIMFETKFAMIADAGCAYHFIDMNRIA